MKTRKILRLSVIIGLLTVSLAKAQDWETRIKNRVDTIIDGRVLQYNYITKKFDGEYYFDKKYKTKSITQQLGSNKIKKIIYSAYNDKVLKYSIIERDSIGHFKNSCYDTTDGGAMLVSETLLEDTINYSFIYEKKYYKSSKLREDDEYDTISHKLWNRKTFYENGAVRRNDYIDDKIQYVNKLYDSLGNEMKWEDYLIDPEVNMSRIFNNIVYPKKYLEAGIQEYVIIKVLVGEDSKIIKAVYDNDNSREFIDNSIFAIKKYAIIKTSKNDGYPVQCWVTFPISFKSR